MVRCGRGSLSLFTVFLTAVLAGCVGSSTPTPSNEVVQSVALTPNAASMDLGATQGFTAVPHNGAGGVVATPVHYVSDNNASLTIATNGAACAGAWDSLTAPVVCTPGVAGVAHVTASAQGVSSPTATVYVHQHIDSIRVTQINNGGPPPHDCFSQGETWNYQATAYSANAVDITNTVGPFNWASTPVNVLSTNTNLTELLPNQVQVTARNPGITQLFASVSGSTSTGIPYTSCLVSAIMLQIHGTSGNSATINAGGTMTLLASTIDTRGNIVSKPTLTWNTSNPEIATVSSGTVSARQNVGAATISASCTPPSCNIGVLPGLAIYSTGGLLANGIPDPSGQPAFGVIKVNTTNTKTPTYTVWAATTDCGDNFACTSAMFPVTAGNNPVGTAATLPRTPNSMLFTPPGSRVYLGSTEGLMYVDVSATPTVNLISQASSPCNVSLCGKVLAISSDGNRVIVSDTQSVPNQVYVFDAANAGSPINLLISGATAAAFSPDGMKAFILAASGNTGSLFVYSTVDALLSAPISTSATDVAFSADGSFAYVAGSPANVVSGFATCNAQNIGAASGLPSNPLQIFPLPTVVEAQIINAQHSAITQNLLALEPPNLQLLTAQFTRDPLPEGQFVCNPPKFLGFNAGPSFNLGQGNFTPLYVQAAADGSEVIVVAKNLPAVLVFHVDGGTTTAIPLVNSAFPEAASSSPDGGQIFVAACDAFRNDDPTQPCVAASVHIVNAQTGGDVQQASYENTDSNNSMCLNLGGSYCIPNLIAVRPQ